MIRTLGIAAAGVLIALSAAACSDDAATIDPSATDTASPGTGPEDSTSGAVPSEPGPLLAFLEDKKYAGWTAEAERHQSTGPHFGGVRVFVNASMEASLQAGGLHPVGAAAIKELYGDDDTVLGWSAMVKVSPESGDGEGWFWYEKYNETVYADSIGAGACTGCHGSGSVDFFKSEFPLK